MILEKQDVLIFKKHKDSSNISEYIKYVDDKDKNIYDRTLESIRRVLITSNESGIVPNKPMISELMDLACNDINIKSDKQKKLLNLLTLELALHGEEAYRPGNEAKKALSQRCNIKIEADNAKELHKTYKNLAQCTYENLFTGKSGKTNDGNDAAKILKDTSKFFSEE